MTSPGGIPLHAEQQREIGVTLTAALDHFVLREEHGFLCMVGERGKIKALHSTVEVLVEQFGALAMVVHVSLQPGEGAWSGGGRFWIHIVVAIVRGAGYLGIRPERCDFVSRG